MRKTTQPQPQIHLKTRKSQPISQKIRDDFYSFDSSPRFYIRQKIYNTYNNPKPLTNKSRVASSSPTNFETLFQKTSPDGFSADWKYFRKKQSPMKKSPETPKFNRGRKKVDYQLNNINTEAKKNIDDFMNYEQRTGKKVLRLDNKSSFERIKGIEGKIVAYKNLSRIFEGTKVTNRDGFESEYTKNYRHPGIDAYRNEGSPFKGPKE